jgi:hypothetical protein
VWVVVVVMCVCVCGGVVVGGEGVGWGEVVVEEVWRNDTTGGREREREGEREIERENEREQERRHVARLEERGRSARRRT